MITEKRYHRIYPGVRYSFYPGRWAKRTLSEQLLLTVLDDPHGEYQTNNQLADTLSTTPATIGRLLKKLQDDSIIEIKTEPYQNNRTVRVIKVISEPPVRI